jgi:hypothetical protein
MEVQHEELPITSHGDHLPVVPGQTAYLEAPLQQVHSSRGRVQKSGICSVSAWLDSDPVSFAVLIHNVFGQLPISVATATPTMKALA